MHRFWQNIIRPCFEKANVRKVVEIGCDLGLNTSRLIRYCKEHNGFLSIVDPSPRIDVDKAYADYQEYYRFYQGLSLNVLWQLSDYDAILIDGDHNWYTVYHELSMIRKSAKRFPIVMFHDISWPYDRRDLYYDPSNIPAQYINAYEQKGINIDTNELAAEGGFNARFHNSVHYHNMRCGVLTAIEDFLSENGPDFSFTMLPLFNGFGILYSVNNRYPEAFTGFVDSLNACPPVKDLMVETDKNFSRMEVRYFKQRDYTDELKASLSQTRAEKEAEKEQARAERERLNAEIGRVRAEDEQRRAALEQGRLQIEEQGRKITALEIDLDGKNGELRRRADEISGIQQAMEEKNKELLALNESLCAVKKDLDTSRDAYIRKIERLQEKYNGVYEQLKEQSVKLTQKHEALQKSLADKDRLQQELAQAKHLAARYRGEADKHFNSVRYRIGTAMIDATSSFKKFIKLPVSLARLYREGKVRPPETPPALETPKGSQAPPAGPAKAPVKKKAKFGRDDIIKINRERIRRNGGVSGSPLVSVIVVSRDGLNNLRRLFLSLEQRDFYDHYEIIVVDNASSDGTAAFLKGHALADRIRVIRNSVNESFSHANNQAAEISRGEYLLFLNNDVEVTDGWLDEMLSAAQSHERAGAVGAKLVYPEIPEGSINSGKSFFIQHRGIAFSHSSFQGQPFIRPHNKGCYDDAFPDGAETVSEQSAVTAAAMLIRKSVFDEAGGFEECYRYGYEDVDLCLKLLRRGYHNYYCPTALLFHFEFGTQSASEKSDVVQRRTNNIEQFKARWQRFLEEKLLEDKLAGTCLYSESPLTAAFAVTEAFDEATAGDYFTALELAGSLEKLGFAVKYLCRRGPGDWYDVGTDTDILISMLDSYDLSKMKNIHSGLITVAWVRNWFDRWCDQPCFSSYSLVLASSRKGCEFIRERSGIRAELFPIATNHERFLRAMQAPASEEQRRRYQSDYVFTGSYWNAPREIIQFMHPQKIPYEFKIFGKNWASVPHLRDYDGGFVPYRDIPQIYKYTKLVIDDANSATKQYGAVNSRVYDALASGRLVLTNGAIGAQETFNGLLPCFNSRQELEDLINRYLGDDALREKKTAELQEFVLKNHTYDIRAKRLTELLKGYFLPDPKKIAVMVPAPRWTEVESWGDYHFAVAMRKVFERRGYTTEIRILPEWDQEFNGKTVVVLRGLSRYTPKNEHVNIMWNISHPDGVAVEEYNRYDAVFIASLSWAQHLKPLVSTHLEPLIQCTDPDVFQPGRADKKYELLFVGNSRKVFRRILRDLLPTSHKLSVYGTNWRGLIDDSYIQGENIPNAQLGREYQACDILLNDHWDDMREKGFISNRIFDGLAAGAFVLSDEIAGVDEVLGGCVVTYRDRDDLRQKIDYYLGHPDEREQIAAKGCRLVRDQHTFAARMDAVLRFIEGGIKDNVEKINLSQSLVDSSPSPPKHKSLPGREAQEPPKDPEGV